MKKVLALLMALVLALSLVACGGENKKEALDALNSAYDYCNVGMNYMIKAWDFSISESSSNTREEYEALWGKFQSKMGMTEDDVVEGLIEECGMTLQSLSKGNDVNRGLNTTIDGMFLMKAEYSVPVARYGWNKKNDNAKQHIEEKLNFVKDYLQNAQGSKSYDLLKDYYLMVNEMYNWIQSPSGTYADASNAVIEYSEKAEKFQSEAELIK